MGTSERPRVAVIGASGIGKHHAKWWALEGAEVCAFVGSTETSVARTRDALERLFGFRGRGYTELGTMLAAERPDFVDVCSPNHLHFAHAEAALAAGCHVLCEKPFVHDPDLDHATLLAQAQSLVAQAARRGLRLGVATQYAVSARYCLDLRSRDRGTEPVLSYRGHLASPTRGRPPDPEPVWIDLAPHLLVVLPLLAPEGEICWETLRTDFRGYDAIAGFTVRRAHGGPDLACELVTGRTLGTGPAHCRRLDLDGQAFEIEGENDEQGVYRSRIRTDTATSRREDPLHLLIREFLAGTPTVDGPAAVRTLEWLLRILD
jgi:hypothetical protein